ncbi:Nif11 family protein [Synechococcus sp. HK05]|uniref:Nif11 family protein n=1 Tax=Synechococcus sp. HK05 TaxID=2725975 RepID=UPI001C38F945|nr:Nif11 family protein [Synechococcus sp. HK05]MBV2350815.1 Nif11 family protein [Synechococcus sp. HK05]
MSISSVRDFIAHARANADVSSQLAECSLESWGDAHTPLDVDHFRVIDVAKRAGFDIDLSDLVSAQCHELDHFWSYEMNNAFVARRAMSRIQMNVSGQKPIGYYY